MPNLRNGSKGGFEPGLTRLRVRHSTTELPRLRHVLLDMSKAFDTISHDILIHKLEHYGIRGICKDWFASYLTNPSQYTEINGQQSTYLKINTGVPQGSILGPILFLIYVNDINNSSNLNILCFVDDTTAYKSGPNTLKT